MASKTILLLLGLTIIAVAYGLPLLEQEEEENTALSFEDFEEYFEQMQMEKRGGKKIGPCKGPMGKCAMCNLKIKNPMNMSRYLACNPSGRGI